MLNKGFIKRSSPLHKIGNLILPKVSTDTLKLLNPNADALILGSSTEEGGDIKIYRDGSGNLALSFDADAASNAEALVIYGGVVAQNYLTVGQTTLNPGYALYTVGDSYFYGNVSLRGDLLFTLVDQSITARQNSAFFNIDLPVVSPDSANHDICLQIDSNNIICARATGDGAGGITDKAIGLYGTTPATQAAAISDPAESTAGNNAAIDSILAALRGIGLIATA
jgi:hypothetical protein